MTTTTLFITRHGETEWNLQKRMQGWLDSPLTELGKKQAEWLSERLQAVNIDVVYSSDSRRAYATAEIICRGKSVEIVKSDVFREINLGDWEGLCSEEIEAFDRDRLNYFWHAPHLYLPVKGETFDDVIRRTHAGIKELIVKHEGKTVLIVTHAAAAKAIMYYFENRTIEKFWDPPFIYQTSLSQIDICENQHQIVLYADTNHYRNSLG